VYRWERRTVQRTVVNIALRSQDILERMAQDHPHTIWGLQEFQILYDPQGILQMLKQEARITPEVEGEFLGDLLDEARSLIGKAERALEEHDLEPVCFGLGGGRWSSPSYCFIRRKEEELTFCTFGRRPRVFHRHLGLRSSSPEYKDLKL